jgi:hypothetical protein
MVGCNRRIHSFQRFNDDLCELLLSYLSISDKIHFECFETVEKFNN